MQKNTDGGLQMKIAVYCGSGMGNDPAFAQAAAELGAWIGENGHTLVYGGGTAGLMGVVAEVAFRRGSTVIGVLPGNVPFICQRPQPFCTQVLTMENMAARKQKMLDLADAFIALPGGIGTLDEISEAITLTKIGVFDKPAVLFNTGSFYAPFRDVLERMIGADLMDASAMQKILFSDSTGEIEAFFARQA